MDKKKILIFMYSLGGGGVQRFVVNLINMINLERYDVCIALVKKKGVHLNDIPESIRIIDLNAKRVHFSLFPLIKCLNREKPDVLFSIDTTINLVAILAKIISRRKTKVIIRQAVDINDFSFSSFKVLLAKMLYPRVDKCIALTKKMQENIIEYTKIQRNKMVVIYNALNVNQIDESKKETAEELLDINVPKIIAVGRLTKQKNISMLVEAFDLVLKERRAKLIILGEGEEKTKLEKKIKEMDIEKEVLMLGYQDNPYKYINNADVFVLSSLYEGLSNALLEAIACEIPIVTTDNPDSIIKGGVNGFQADLTAECIAGKINDLLGNKKLCEDIKKNNNEYKNSFDISHMVNSYEVLFSDIT